MLQIVVGLRFFFNKTVILKTKQHRQILRKGQKMIESAIKGNESINATIFYLFC